MFPQSNDPAPAILSHEWTDGPPPFNTCILCGLTVGDDYATPDEPCPSGRFGALLHANRESQRLLMETRDMLQIERDLLLDALQVAASLMSFAPDSAEHVEWMRVCDPLLHEAGREYEFGSFGSQIAFHTDGLPHCAEPGDPESVEGGTIAAWCAKPWPCADHPGGRYFDDANPEAGEMSPPTVRSPHPARAGAALTLVKGEK